MSSSESQKEKKQESKKDNQDQTNKQRQHSKVLDMSSQRQVNRNRNMRGQRQVDHRDDDNATIYGSNFNIPRANQERRGRQQDDEREMQSDRNEYGRYLNKRQRSSFQRTARGKFASRCQTETPENGTVQPQVVDLEVEDENEHNESLKKPKIKESLKTKPQFRHIIPGDILGSS